MSKPRAQQNPEVSQRIAEPVRRRVINLIKARVNSPQSREELASTLGKSLDAVNDMLSRDKGGFDFIVAALIVTYGLDNDAIERLFDAMGDAVPSHSQSDKRWRALPLDEQTRLQFVTAIEMAIAANRP